MSSIVTAPQAISAGKIAEAESKVQAQQIETEAAAREADRKEALSRAISSQFAQTGASGVGITGSPLAIIEEDIRQEEQATERADLQKRIEFLAAKTRGKVARKQGVGRAVGLLLADAEKAAKAAAPAGAKGGGGGGK